jgi:xanthine dehydrogenase accessory factor
MTSNNALLVDFFERRRDCGEMLVLATVVHTEGSTYRKPGAQMLIARDGQVAGLLSGGCAESDLLERANKVFATGDAQIADYDTRGTDDAIWGIGLGCEGAMRILLTRLDTNNGYEPFAFIADSLRSHRNGAFALVVAGGDNISLGSVWNSESQSAPAGLAEQLRSGHTGTIDVGTAKIFVSPIALPPRVLILGAGADAQPLVDFMASLGWQVTIVDHRPAYAQNDRFSRARRVLLTPAAEVSSKLALDEFDAAVVMSHHLPTDHAYLAMLSRTKIPYVGLLGPQARRMRLLNELGDSAAALNKRLAGPVGLDIGAQSAEAIALAIAAEIHAHMHGRTGASFSGMLNASPHHEQ